MTIGLYHRLVHLTPYSYHLVILVFSFGILRYSSSSLGLFMMKSCVYILRLTMQLTREGNKMHCVRIALYTLFH